VTSTKTKYNQSEAARISQKSRTTITQHMKAGKLAYDVDGNGTKIIEASELMRVYGDDCDFGRANSSHSAFGKPERSATSEQGLHSELNTAQQLLDAERKERQREREQLQSQIDRLEGALERSQDSHNRMTHLLEDRSSGVGEWEKSFKALETRVVNQENQFQKEKVEKDQAKRQIERLKRALGEEQNKTFLQKLFG